MVFLPAVLSQALCKAAAEPVTLGLFLVRRHREAYSRPRSYVAAGGDSAGQVEPIRSPDRAADGEQVGSNAFADPLENIMRTSDTGRSSWLAPFLLAAPLCAFANPVLEWNDIALKATIESRQGPPMTARTMAVVHSAVFDAVNAIQPKYRAFKFSGTAAPGASPDAAAAAAAHTALVSLFPGQRATFDQALAVSLARVPEGPARTGGVALGTLAAQTILTWCADDRVGAVTQYRPVTKAGSYIPTTMPVSHDFALSRPWLLKTADQFRPPAPPALTGETWARDLNEVQRVGARASTTRTAEQTEVARFWVITGAPAFNGVVRQAMEHRKLDTLASARVAALVYMAFNDALVSVFDAKYEYQFWRPLTAVRNGDQYVNAAIQRDGGWLPLVDAPMHPEYPCAHCISAATVGQVLQSELGDAVGPMSMVSPTLPGVTRRWNKVSEVVEEVSNARVWSGVHYRFSAEAASRMGKEIGRYAVANYLQPLP